MIRRLAGVLVFVASGGVLVVELTAIRLLAPYVGQTLEVVTAIIATVLAGIATGTWVGGRLADVTDPRKLIVAELVAGGALTVAVVPLVRLFGPTVSATSVAGLVGITLVTLFAPAASLSAVSPGIVKLLLEDLGQTGSVVGRMSAIGTAGAIAGSLLTGFGLVAWFSSPAILIGVGGLFTGAGLALAATAGTFRFGMLSVVLVFAPAFAVESPCLEETDYSCVQIEPDPTSPTGRTLVLDDLSHSYVDLADPTELRFTYTRMFAAVIDAELDGAVEAVHVGGGAWTMPRWLEATRPGSESTILEIDGRLVDFVRERLGAGEVHADVVVGDARITLDQLEADSADVVIGDAFGNRAVPWHLTTVQAHESIDRVLRDGGVYVVNVIDGRRLDLVRSLAATLREVWPEVALIAPPERLEIGGNFVLAASTRLLDAGAIVSEAAALDLPVVVVQDAELESFVSGASPLTDAYAPVDQLISR